MHLTSLHTTHLGSFLVVEYIVQKMTNPVLFYHHVKSCITGKKYQTTTVTALQFCLESLVYAHAQCPAFHLR